ncbi:hypothetical protein BABINDRAFT_158929 [Babjeviella inositovora NRRL Y-12698]|uniref:Aspartyl aminopeptidase n=1 Tax=Babjeviella inositovora NRRL Y-12698 TaxID=984486 RepID=A0A1E3QYZ1_9ASCO|nr:uncharacterized protein BABINDRAFT_158929 [Babjeviella inositovora NRRL Y-12698]ODQ82307.1 hypothetical protein BABINDRAFT_158929 [Babjeviella inositovora NRRL Y-12698]
MSDSDFHYVSLDDLPTPPSEAQPASPYHAAADAYIRFTNENPTTYHVVEHFSALLTAHGFTYVAENKSWDLSPGRYFTTRSGTSLCAFVVGEDWKPEYGFGAIGSHIDSLTVKLKPFSAKANVDGYCLLGVAPYSGSLNDLWLDRDLGIGGKVLVKVAGGKTESRLVSSAPSPVARIPSLAKHFGWNGTYNKETQMVPVMGYSSEPTPTDLEKTAPLYGKHSLGLLRYIANLAKTAVEDVVQVDLDLFDVHRATVGGLSQEFIFGPRTDDRLCSFAAVWGLLSSLEDPSDSLSSSFSIACLFDNEEIGSGTRQGARGGLLQAVVERVSAANAKAKDLSRATAAVVYANSFIVSADVTHCLNPNFKNVYLANHYPIPNTGITVKSDPNGHVTTESIGLTVVQGLADLNGDKLQPFHIRNDGRSGGTIGPFISSDTGARTIDVGICQLSMHSIRAMFGRDDVGLGAKFFAGFYRNWREVYDTVGDL